MADTPTPSPSEGDQDAKPKLRLRRISSSAGSKLAGQDKAELLSTPSSTPPSEPPAPPPPPPAVTPPAVQPPAEPQKEPTPTNAPEVNEAEPALEAPSSDSALEPSPVDQQLFQNQAPETAPERAKGRHIRQILLIACILLVLISGLGGLAYYLFASPSRQVADQEQVAAFLKPEPQPGEPVIQPAVEKPVEQVESLASSADLVDWILQQKPARSRDPEGIFVGQVLIPTGSIIDPRFGLILEKVDLSAQQPAAHLVDTDGNRFSVPLR